ncbi:MAG: sigma-70 family RNA polymerase sigma factor [Saprospiraceae bacterium]
MQDALLIEKCIRGNELAQYQLYQRFAQPMYHTAWRMVGNGEDAKDVLQQAFIKIFSNLHTVQDIQAVAGWIKRIVINTALDHLQGKRRWRIEPQEYIPELAIAADAEIKMAVQEMHDMIMELPDGCKQVFCLYLLEGYKHQEIAEMLEITESTSKSQYWRAKQLLKQKITTHEQTGRTGTVDPA